MSSPHDVRSPHAVDLEHVSKVFGHGHEAVRALDDVSLRVEPGEFVCLVGASGSQTCNARKTARR